MDGQNSKSSIRKPTVKAQQLTEIRFEYREDNERAWERIFFILEEATNVRHAVGGSVQEKAQSIRAVDD